VVTVSLRSHFFTYDTEVAASPLEARDGEGGNQKRRRCRPTSVTPAAVNAEVAKVIEAYLAHPELARLSTRDQAP
jgi:hypothetical protein